MFSVSFDIAPLTKFILALDRVSENSMKREVVSCCCNTVVPDPVKDIFSEVKNVSPLSNLTSMVSNYVEAISPFIKVMGYPETRAAYIKLTSNENIIDLFNSDPFKIYSDEIAATIESIVAGTESFDEKTDLIYNLLRKRIDEDKAGKKRDKAGKTEEKTEKNDEENAGKEEDETEEEKEKTEKTDEDENAGKTEIVEAAENAEERDLEMDCLFGEFKKSEQFEDKLEKIQKLLTSMSGKSGTEVFDVIAEENPLELTPEICSLVNVFGNMVKSFENKTDCDLV